MNSKEIFENYWQNKQLIALLNSEINMRKGELLPSMTSTLSLTSKAKNNTSGVEQTFENWEDDKRIQALKRQKQKTEQSIILVDTLLCVLEPVTGEIIKKRYLDKFTVEKVAETFDISVSTVNRKIKKAFQKLDSIYNTIL